MTMRVKPFVPSEAAKEDEENRLVSSSRVELYGTAIGFRALIVLILCEF